MLGEELRGRSPSVVSLTSTTARKKVVPVAVNTVQKKFTIKLNSGRRIESTEGATLGVRLGLYHGGDALCEPKASAEVNVSDGDADWEESIPFDINVCDVPRMGRLCLALYEKSRNKITNLRWVNLTVFDYKGILRNGCIALSAWKYEHDIDDEMLHPLGTVVTNPAVEAATLTITFGKYLENDVPIAHPSSESHATDNGLGSIKERTLSESEPDLHATPKTSRIASKNYEQLRQICERDPLTEMHEQDKELLWYLKADCCKALPHSLPHILKSVKWNIGTDVAQMMDILTRWPPLNPEKALGLLDYAYADVNVRAFAVKCLSSISDDDLLLYLLQLVQALKYESYLHNHLALFLLDRSLKNQHIGHHLFWLLRSEMHDPSVSVIFGLLLEAYCRGAPDHMKGLAKQMEATKKLKQLTEVLKEEVFKAKISREKQKSKMQDITSRRYYKDALSNVISPLNPRYRLGHIKVEKCKFMDSKMKPLWLVFSNDDFGAEDVFVIYKNGDGKSSHVWRLR